MLVNGSEGDCVLIDCCFETGQRFQLAMMSVSPLQTGCQVNLVKYFNDTERIPILIVFTQ